MKFLTALIVSLICFIPSFLFTQDSIKFAPCPQEVKYAGRTYNTVQIGSQCWLKNNLNIGRMIEDSTKQNNNTIIEKYCYYNSEVNCKTYGGLYRWDEAMQYSTTEGAQGICPEGWHIPTYAEIKSLRHSLGDGGDTLIKKGNVSGSEADVRTSAFSALFSGRIDDKGNFSKLGLETTFWSSQKKNDINAYGMRVTKEISLPALYFGKKVNGYSVRCLKD